jgi:hypothetical protein
MRRTYPPVVVAVTSGVAIFAADCSDRSDAKMPPDSLPSELRVPAAKKPPITIAFAGDTHFYAQLSARLADPGTALGPTTL